MTTLEQFQYQALAEPLIALPQVSLEAWMPSYPSVVFFIDTMVADGMTPGSAVT